MASESTPPFIQLDLYDAGWPPHDRFPFNNRYAHVEDCVFPDLLRSSHPLIITGYTSLGKLLDFFVQSQLQVPPLQDIRIMLGHEPLETQREDFSHKKIQFSDTFEQYWLSRGISLYKSASVLLAIDLLQRHIIQVRIVDERYPLHAKIYKGDSAITIGSSNFSTLGLKLQTEANVRFQSHVSERVLVTHPRPNWQREIQAAEERGMKRAEQQRFLEASQFAEHLWMEGRDYSEQLLALLQRLLRTVTWEEALARACAEVLEGTWAQQYMQEITLREGSPLWPSQEQGIAQAMWIIEHVGSVLIADATGSGKTLLGTHLMRAVMTRIWSHGHRRRHDLPVLISPASMVREWERTSIACGQPIKVYSDGLLSTEESERHQEIEAAIRRAQVLAVDEAHRYHNRRSTRTRQLYYNLADHVLLFTATPVNRGPSDLLALIDLLGADNFDDEIIDIFERFSATHRKEQDEMMSISERIKLQRAIQQFTVRRTKHMLNTMIEKEPHRYRDIRGYLCRYPMHKAHFYTHQETSEDLALAHEIRGCAEQLQGLFALTSPFFLSEAQRRDGITEESYLQWRLRGAHSLAVYNVMEKLRSSRIALIEHLCGTHRACDHFGLSHFWKTVPTGNMLVTLQNQSGKLPENRLTIPLPPFLTDEKEHQWAIEEEIARYQRILELVNCLSDAREQTKVQLLLALLKAHPQLLAFDDTILSLVYFKFLLDPLLPQGHILLATSNDPAGRKQVQEMTRLGSTARDVIALCSDAMSEGLNMQSASVVVHLTMPTVIRVAEQRVGRVDRMNSPHPCIESYWPEEKPVFALRADERFFSRHQFVAEYLGSNLTLPGASIVNVHEMAQWQTSHREEDDLAEWRHMHDAFEPVRDLIAGDHRLVRDTTIYERLRHTSARVLSSVSIVEASHPWAFFAIAGTEWGAPRWVYLDGETVPPVTDLEQISGQLRQHLAHEQTRQRDFDDITASYLTQFLRQLNDAERSLLPMKKQRALVEMSIILKAYQIRARLERDQHREEVAHALFELVENTNRELSVDWNSLAEDWLDLIRPTWYDYHQRRRKKTPLLLKELRQELLADPLSTDQLEDLLRRRSWTRPLDERIVAAIVGIPSPGNSQENREG